MEVIVIYFAEESKILENYIKLRQPSSYVEYACFVSPVLLGHTKMWRVRLPWESREICSRVPRRVLYRECRCITQFAHSSQRVQM